MNVQSFLDNMTKIHKDLLQYLDNTDNIEENYQNLQVSLSDQNINEDSHNLKSVLHLVANIATNHYRYPNFFEKIEKVLTNLLSNINHSLSNHEIFNIFKKNKRLLLFFIKKELITIDEYIFDKMKTDKYSRFKYEDYFYPEIQQFCIKQDHPLNEKNLPEDFEEKRNQAENDNVLCKLIQKDSIDEIISYINQNNLSLNSTIEQSIYETNQLILKKQNKKYSNEKITLIEYAAFFGSIQVFNYLYKNNVKLTSSLWIYAIHGDHPELFNILEENKVEHDKETSFEILLYESIICHHNDMANYILNNYIKDEQKIKDDILFHVLKSYNFGFLQYDLDDDSLFYLVRYEYYLLVKLILTEKKIDVNQIYIIDNIEETLLCYAIEKNIKEIIQLLLSIENVDVNSPKKNFGLSMKSNRSIYKLYI